MHYCRAVTRIITVEHRSGENMAHFTDKRMGKQTEAYIFRQLI